VLGAWLELGAAVALTALLVTAAVFYTALSARRPGWWRVALAPAFTLGWVIFLIPVVAMYFYASPWDLTLSGPGAYADLDLCTLVGSVLLLGSMLGEVAPWFSPKNWRRPIAATADKLMLFGVVVTSSMMKLAVNLSTDTLIRSQPDFAAQEAWMWWAAMVGMVIGMVLLVLAQRAQSQRAVAQGRASGAS
jgi:hypothetical protein